MNQFSLGYLAAGLGAGLASSAPVRHRPPRSRRDGGHRRSQPRRATSAPRYHRGSADRRRHALRRGVCIILAVK